MKSICNSQVEFIHIFDPQEKLEHHLAQLILSLGVRRFLCFYSFESVMMF